MYFPCHVWKLSCKTSQWLASVILVFELLIYIHMFAWFYPRWCFFKWYLTMDLCQTASFTKPSKHSNTFPSQWIWSMANCSGKQLHLKGHGDGLHVDIEPSTNFSLGPVLPGTENCVQELFLVNPTEYTIEAHRHLPLTHDTEQPWTTRKGKHYNV